MALQRFGLQVSKVGRHDQHTRLLAHERSAALQHVRDFVKYRSGASCNSLVSRSSRCLGALLLEDNARGGVISGGARTAATVKCA